MKKQSDFSRLMGYAGRYRVFTYASWVLSAISALVLVALGQVAVVPILGLLQTPDAIKGNTVLYLRIMFGGVPIVMAYNLFAGMIRSLGDSKTPLYAMIVASCINISLDLLFVLVFHWGIAGAAVATLIAQVFAAGYCLWHLRKIPILNMQREDFRLDWSQAGQLLQLGFPMAFQNAIISVGGMIVQSVVNGFGMIFIAGFTATNKLYGILEIAATSYGYAMISYVGQNLGARKIERIRAGQRAAIGLAMATSCIIAAVMIGFGRWIVGCFISGTPQEVEAATQVAYRYLVIMSGCLPVLYVLHVTRSCVQGMGNTVLPMLSGVSEFVMRTGAALLLPMAMGQAGIFYAEVLAWAGADLILVPSYFVVSKRCRKNLA